MNKKNIIKLLFIFSIFVFIVSCRETINNAIELDLTKLYNDYVNGYDWFKVEYDNYIIKDDYIDSLKYYHSNIYKFIIFAKPSCSCGNEYKKFPYFIKILDTIGVNRANIEVFSIGNSDYSHPYKNKFIINQLPTFMILKNDDVIYSINDTILKYNNKSLEETLLNGLMQ